MAKNLQGRYSVLSKDENWTEGIALHGINCSTRAQATNSRTRPERGGIIVHTAYQLLVARQVLEPIVADTLVLLEAVVGMWRAGADCEM